MVSAEEATTEHSSIFIKVYVANVHEGPSTDDRVIAQLNLGDTLFFQHEERSGWLRVKRPGLDDYGWIRDSLISESPKGALILTRTPPSTMGSQ